MDLEHRFQQLPAELRLAIAAAALQRVLPIYCAQSQLDPEPLRDGVRLVTLAGGGRKFTRQQATTAINAVTELIVSDRETPAHSVCVAVISALEAVSHNIAATLDCLDQVAEAAHRLAGADARSEERQWLTWAVDRAEEQPRTESANFNVANAPRPTWQQVLHNGLPLFENRRGI